MKKTIVMELAVADVETIAEMIFTDDYFPLAHPRAEYKVVGDTIYHEVKYADAEKLVDSIKCFFEEFEIDYHDVWVEE